MKLDKKVGRIRVMCYATALECGDYITEWIEYNMQPGDVLYDAGGDLFVVKKDERTNLAMATFRTE